MAAFRTPRAPTTLRVKGSISAQAAGRPGTKPLVGPGGVCIRGTGINGENANCDGYVTAPWGNPLSPPFIDWAVASSGTNVGIRVRVYDGFGSVQTHDFFIFRGSPTNWSVDIAGDFEFAVDVAEWCDPDIAVTDTGTVDGSEFPAFEASANGDGLPALGATFYEAAVVGGTVLATITIDGTTIASSSVIASPFVVGYTPTCHHRQESVNRVGSSVVSCKVEGRGDTIIPSFTRTENLGYTISGLTITGGEGLTSTISHTGTTSTDACDGSVVIGGECESTFTFAPEKNLDLAVRLRMFEEAYTGSLVCRYISGVVGGFEAVSELTCAPNGSVSINQKQFSLAGRVNLTTLTPVSVDTFAATRAWMKQSSLVDASEDSRDWRLQFRGQKRDVLTLTHDSYKTIDTGDPANWADSANVTVSSSGGNVRLTAGGGTGRAIRTYTPVQNSEGYRYWRLRLRASDVFPVEIWASGKKWTTADLSTSFATVDLDSAMWENETDEVFSKRTRNDIRGPSDTPADGYPQLQMEFGWGFNWIEGIEIEGIPDGEWVEVDYIELRRLDHVSLTLLAPFLYNPLLWDSETDNTYGQPYWITETDDRGPVDLWHAARVVPLSGDPYWDWLTQSELADYINAIPGFTATRASDDADGYHTDALPAMLLGGLGATYNHEAAEGVDPWFYWVRADCHDIVVPSQDCWDQVSIYPGAGEVWTGGDYNVPTKLVVSKSLRARGSGLVGKPDGEVFTSADVVLYRDTFPALIYGTDVTGTRGEYLTELPYVTTRIDQTSGPEVVQELRQGEMPYLSDLARAYSRAILRASFRRAGTAADSVDYDVGPSLRHYRAYIREIATVKTLFLGHAGNAKPIAWDDVQTLIDGLTWAAIRAEDRGAIHYVWIIWGDGSTVYLTRTDDEGETKEDLLTIASATIGDFEITRHGHRWFYWRNTDDTVGYAVYDAFDTLIKTDLTNITDCADKPIRVRESVDGNGQWRMGIVYNSGSSILHKLADDGFTFS